MSASQAGGGESSSVQPTFKAGVSSEEERPYRILLVRGMFEASALEEAIYEQGGKEAADCLTVFQFAEDGELLPAASVAAWPILVLAAQTTALQLRPGFIYRVPVGLRVEFHSQRAQGLPQARVKAIRSGTLAWIETLRSARVLRRVEVRFASAASGAGAGQRPTVALLPGPPPLPESVGPESRAGAAANGVSRDGLAGMIVGAFAARGVGGLELFQHTVLERRLSRVLAEREMDVAALLRAVEYGGPQVHDLAAALLGQSQAADPDAIPLEQSFIEGFVDRVERGASPLVWIMGPSSRSGAEVYLLAARLGAAFLRRGLPLEALKVFCTSWSAPFVLGQRTAGLEASSVEALRDDEQQLFDMEPTGFAQPSSTLRSTLVFAVHHPIGDPPYPNVSLCLLRVPLGLLVSPAREAVVRAVKFALRRGGHFFIPGTGNDAVPDELLPAPFVSEPKWAGTFRVDAAAPKGEARNGSGRVPPARRDRVVGQLCDQLLGAIGLTGYLLDHDGRVRRSVGAKLQAPEDAPGAGLAKRDVESRVRGGLEEALRARQGGGADGRLHRFQLEVVGQQLVDMVRVPIDSGTELDSIVVALPVARRDDGGQSTATASVVAQLIARADAGKAYQRNLSSLGTEYALAPLRDRVIELEAQLVDADAQFQDLVRDRARQLRLLDSSKQHLRRTESALRLGAVGALHVDQDLCVRSFSAVMEQFFPLRTTDLGRPLSDLSLGAAGPKLLSLVERVRTSNQATQGQVITSSGTSITVCGGPSRAEDCDWAGFEFLFIRQAKGFDALGDRAAPTAFFGHLAEHAGEVFWVRDCRSQEFVYISPACAKVWGLSAVELVSGSEDLMSSIHPDDLRLYSEWMQSTSQGDSEAIEYRVLLPGGRVQWILDQAFPHYRREGREYFMGVAQNISMRKDAEARLKSAAEALQQQANRDPLTGTLNRRGLERSLGRELERLRRTGSWISAILIDCDDFKAINDSLGHAAGDTALRMVSSQLSEALRPTDVLGRVGGDEFLVLLPSTREAEAWRIAERLRLSLSDRPIRVGHDSLAVTASLGVAAVSPNVISLDQVIDQTQHALASSKRGGKNRVSTRDPQNPPHSEAERATEDALAAMTMGEGLEVFAQEIIDLRTGAVAGQEFLIRGPDGPYRSPADLFRIAMERNCLTTLDRRCMQRCLEVAAEIETPGLMHVNVLPSTLLGLDRDKLEEMFGWLPSHHQFCVEISEQQFIGDPQYLKQPVVDLKRLGILVAIDDVGFGRSSLESLVLLEPDIIKIDRSFVDGASGDEVLRHSLERLLAVSMSLSPQVVAEGIETEDDMRLVQEFGVPYGQGYLWSKPRRVEL